MKKVQIANLNRLDKATERKQGTKYEARHYEIGFEMGTEKIGFNVTEIPPGKTAFPYHLHHVNEEVFIVLDGEGTLRTPEGEKKVAQGDLIYCPTGPSGAHQIINSGKKTLKYLAMSSLENPEIAEYPDSEKFAASLRPHRKEKSKDFIFRMVGFKKDAKDYWAGEE